MQEPTHWGKNHEGAEVAATQYYVPSSKSPRFKVINQAKDFDGTYFAENLNLPIIHPENMNPTACPLCCSIILATSNPPLTLSLPVQKLLLSLKLLYGTGTQCTWRERNIRCIQETLKCGNVLWHEGAKSHESEDKEDGWAKVCHEQLVAQKSFERGEKCISCLLRTFPF